MLPRLLRRLFQNDGAGPMLRPDIFPLDGETISVNGEGKIGAKASGLPLLALLPSFSSLVEEGCLSVCVDNGVLSGDPASTTYPAYPNAYAQLENRKLAGDTAIRTMQEYADSLAACGKAPFFAIDTVAKTFRIPKADGLFWRAVMAGKSVGDYGIDQMRAVTGSAVVGSPQDGGAGTGALSISSRGGWSVAGSSASNTQGVLGFNSALLGPNFDGEQTLPEHAIVDWQMRMYGTVTDAGAIELAQLIAAIAGKLDTSEYEADAPMRVKAWVRKDASGNILKSFGIASVTIPATGRHRITLLSPAPDTNYVVLALSGSDGLVTNVREDTFPRTTTQFEVNTFNYSSGAGAASILNVMVIY